MQRLSRARLARYELAPLGIRVKVVEPGGMRTDFGGRSLDFCVRGRAARGLADEALARHYLENTRLPVAQASFLLGFEEPDSFHRAFKGWTGATPDEVRRGGERVVRR